MADPIESVRALYRHVGQEVTPLHARRMQAFLDHRLQDAFGRHRYDAADFGWTYPGLAVEIEDYIERYGIQAESVGAAPGADSPSPTGGKGLPHEPQRRREYRLRGC